MIALPDCTHNHQPTTKIDLNGLRILLPAGAWGPPSAIQKPQDAGARDVHQPVSRWASFVGINGVPAPGRRLTMRLLSRKT